MIDLVYPLSPGPLDYSELRYSLRSLEVNTSAERVHFFGGKPGWLRTGLHHRTRQPHDKWKNARIQFRTACQSDEVSDPFLWMNDDFFVLQPVGSEPPLWHGGDFKQWLDDLGVRYARSKYATEANMTIKALRSRMGPHARPVCWSLHTPILIHKATMLEALDLDAKHGERLHLRTLYGNLHEFYGGLGGEQAPVHDVKGTSVPSKGIIYASTSNQTWRGGDLGRHIRSKFPEPSRWERA